MIGKFIRRNERPKQERPEPPPIPPTTPYNKNQDPESREFYRIGYDSGKGLTTITLLDRGGLSMTLYLNQSACEQMIRMIRATYLEEAEE